MRECVYNSSHYYFRQKKNGKKSKKRQLIPIGILIVNDQQSEAVILVIGQFATFDRLLLLLNLRRSYATDVVNDVGCQAGNSL
jgi:hypothetical protein